MVKSGRGAHALPPLLPPTGSVVEGRDLQSNTNKRVADLGPPAVRSGKGRGRGRGGSLGPPRGGLVPRGIAPPVDRAAASQRGSTVDGGPSRGSRGPVELSSRGGPTGPSNPFHNHLVLPDRSDPADDRSGRGWVTDNWRPSDRRDNWRDVPFRSSYDYRADDRHYGRGRDDRCHDDRYGSRRYDDYRRHDDYGSYSPAGPSDYRDRRYSPSRPAREAYVDESYDALALSPTRRHGRFSDCEDDGLERPSPAKMPRLSDFDRESPRKAEPESYIPVEGTLRASIHVKHEERRAGVPRSAPDTSTAPSKGDERGRLTPSADSTRPGNVIAKPSVTIRPDPPAKEEGVRPPAPGRSSTPPPVEKLKFKPTKPKPKPVPVPSATTSSTPAPSHAAKPAASAQPVPAIRSDAKEEGVTVSQTGPISTAALSGQEADDGTRLEGVISYKRFEVPPSCFSTNKAAKTTARETLVADVAETLKKEGRAITKVWWRDDGVGFDWVSTAPAPPAIPPSRYGIGSGDLADTPRTAGSVVNSAFAAMPAKPAVAHVGTVETPDQGRQRAGSKTGLLGTKTFTFPADMPEHSNERLHFIERRTLEASQLDSRFRPTVKVDASATTSCVTLSISSLTHADRPVQPFERHWLLESKGSTMARHFPVDNPIKDELGSQGKKWKSHITEGQRTHKVPIPRLYEATAEEDLTLAEYIDFCRTEVHAQRKYKIGLPTRRVVCSREGRFLSITSRPCNSSAQKTPIGKEKSAREAGPVSQHSGASSATSSGSKDKVETKRARKSEGMSQDGDRPQSSKKARVVTEIPITGSGSTLITGRDPSLAPLPLAQSPAKKPKLEPVSPIKRPTGQTATLPTPLSAAPVRHASFATSSTSGNTASPSTKQTEIVAAPPIAAANPTRAGPAASSAPMPLVSAQPTLITQPPTPHATPVPEARPQQKRATPVDQKSSIVAGLEAQLAAKLAKITQWTDLMDKYPDQRAHFQRQVDRMEHDIFDIHQQIEQAKAAAAIP